MIPSLSELYYFDNVDESFECGGILEDLLRLSDKQDDAFYCADTDNGPRFFSSYEELKRFMDRDWCECRWEDLSDDELELWVERLHTGKLEWNI